MMQTSSWSRRTFFKAAAMTTAALASQRLIGQAADTTDPVESFRHQLAGPIKVSPLGTGLWLLSGDGGNIVALSTSEGKLVVDSGVLPDADKLVTTIRGLDARPLRTLVNTHWHFDHTDGNAALHAAGAQIVAHENTLKRMSAPQVVEAIQAHVPASPRNALPTVTFDGRKELRLGGEVAELVYLRPAHTDTDIYVHFPKHDVLHTGDLVFATGYPLIDYSTGGRIQGMIDGADTLLKVAGLQTKIVPGHGPLQTRAQLQRYRDVLATIRDRVADAKQKGKTVEEVQAMKVTKDFDAERGPGFVTPDQITMLAYRTL